MSSDLEDSPELESISEEDLARRVLQERLEIGYESLGKLFQAVFVAVLLVSAMIWSPENGHLVSIWSAVTLLVGAVRLQSLRRFRRMSQEERETKAKALHRNYLIGAAFGGFSWGLLAILLWDPNNLALDMLIVLAIAGLCSGSIVTLAAFGEATLIFITMAMGLLAVRMVYQGAIEAYTMAALAEVEAARGVR